MELISLRSKGSGVYAASLSGKWQDVMGFADRLDGWEADVLEVRRIYHTDMGVILLRRLKDGPEVSADMLSESIAAYEAAKHQLFV